MKKPQIQMIISFEVGSIYRGMLKFEKAICDIQKYRLCEPPSKHATLCFKQLKKRCVATGPAQNRHPHPTLSVNLGSFLDRFVFICSILGCFISVLSEDVGKGDATSHWWGLLR